jgi:hypothetical protein
MLTIVHCGMQWRARETRAIVVEQLHHRRPTSNAAWRLAHHF